MCSTLGSIDCMPGCLGDLENLKTLENRYSDLENLEKHICLQFDLKNHENSHFLIFEKNNLSYFTINSLKNSAGGAFLLLYALMPKIYHPFHK